MNFTNKTMAQGALILTLSAGGVFYTTSDQTTSAGNGCIEYINVDGSSKKLCGESAALVLKEATQEEQRNNTKFDKEPLATASLPRKSKNNCQLKKDAGQALGPFCKISLALDTKP